MGMDKVHSIIVRAEQENESWQTVFFFYFFHHFTLLHFTGSPVSPCPPSVGGARCLRLPDTAAASLSAAPAPSALAVKTPAAA